MNVLRVAAPDEDSTQDTHAIPPQGSSRMEEARQRQREMFAPPQGDLFEVVILGYEPAP